MEKLNNSKVNFNNSYIYWARRSTRTSVNKCELYWVGLGLAFRVRKRFKVKTNNSKPIKLITIK